MYSENKSGPNTVLFSVESAMPSSARVERIWWLTVSNAEDKSRRMTNDELD